MIQIATQPPAKVPDIRRIGVHAATETPFPFDGVRTVIGFHIQLLDEAALYIGLTPNSTFSPDNYYTLKSGHVMVHRDINWTTEETALYLRSTGEYMCEVWYWG